MKAKILILSLILIALSGCDRRNLLMSLFPFYQQNQEILKPEIEGEWSVTQTKNVTATDTKDNSSPWNGLDTTSVWKISRNIRSETKKDSAGNGDTTIFIADKFYKLELKKPNSDTVLFRLNMVLFKVEGVLYADFSSLSGDMFEQSRLLSDNLVKVHTLAKISVTNNRLQFIWLDSKCVQEMIENKRVRLHFNSTNQFILTGNTAELTRMLKLYGNQKRFIDWSQLPIMLELTKQTKS